MTRFPGRRAVIVVLNALMGLPSVVVGLVVYLLLSRAGPLGALGILFTPTAMVIAQTILVLPIVAALARQVVEDAWREYREQLALARRVGRCARCRRCSGTCASRCSRWCSPGFGRAASEVGAVMIVGGNIDGVTRVMTTAIALETSKGDLPLALAPRHHPARHRARAQRRRLRDPRMERAGAMAERDVLPAARRAASRVRLGGRTVLDGVDLDARRRARAS